MALLYPIENQTVAEFCAGQGLVEKPAAGIAFPDDGRGFQLLIRVYPWSTLLWVRCLVGRLTWIFYSRVQLDKE